MVGTRHTGQAAIEDHGVIGDLHTAALVSTDEDVDELVAAVSTGLDRVRRSAPVGVAS